MSDAPAPFLRLSGVSKRFGGVLALDRIDWDVLPGEVHCLVGENGCGKSTLIKLVAGVHQPDPGSEIEIGGAVREALSPAEAKSLGIQVIYQDLSLFPNLTVAENIAFDHNLAGLARPVRYGRMREIARGLLQRLGVALPLDAPVGSLSIAERQVVAICRGLAADAKLLFMDEPTASLTRAEVKALLGFVERLRSEGVAVVFVSHRLDEVVEIAERVTVMRDGRKVGTYAAGEVDARRIGELMTGLVIDQAISARDVGEATPLLEVRGPDPSRRVPGRHLHLAARRGAGPDRAARGRPHRAGALPVRHDPARFRRDPARGQPDHGVLEPGRDRRRHRLCLRGPPQSRPQYAPVGRRQSRPGFARTASPTRLGWIMPQRRRALAGEWVDRLHIKIPGLDNPVQQLSGGNQQRVVLGKWLATAPKVLILDSPTVGVDIGNKRGIYELVRSLAASGVGILLISDEVPEVYYNCDRVLHMRDGPDRRRGHSRRDRRARARGAGLCVSGWAGSRSTPRGCCSS